jgi:hypothetical protein
VNGQKKAGEKFPGVSDETLDNLEVNLAANQASEAHCAGTEQQQAAGFRRRLVNIAAHRLANASESQVGKVARKRINLVQRRIAHAPIGSEEVSCTVVSQAHQAAIARNVCHQGLCTCSEITEYSADPSGPPLAMAYIVPFL